MLEGLKPLNALRPCLVRTISETLNPADAKIFLDAVNDVNYWKAESLTKALASRGVTIGSKAITRHRQNGCSCSELTDA